MCRELSFSPKVDEFVLSEKLHSKILAPVPNHSITTLLVQPFNNILATTGTSLHWVGGSADGNAATHLHLMGNMLVSNS